MNYLDYSFSLPIGLRVLHRASDVFDVKLLVKFCKSTVDEFFIVANDDNVWYAKMAYYILSYEILNISCCNGC